MIDNLYISKELLKEVTESAGGWSYGENFLAVYAGSCLNSVTTGNEVE